MSVIKHRLADQALQNHRGIIFVSVSIDPAGHTNRQFCYFLLLLLTFRHLDCFNNFLRYLWSKFDIESNGMLSLVEVELRMVEFLGDTRAIEAAETHINSLIAFLQSQRGEYSGGEATRAFVFVDQTTLEVVCVIVQS